MEHVSRVESEGTLMQICPSLRNLTLLVTNWHHAVKQGIHSSLKRLVNREWFLNKLEMRARMWSEPPKIETLVISEKLLGGLKGRVEPWVGELEVVQ